MENYKLKDGTCKTMKTDQLRKNINNEAGEAWDSFKNMRL